MFFLEVKNLKKYFSTPSGMLHAVDNISFSIEEGKTMGVVGESGCGKSTLGRVILHLLDSTGGKIIYKGEDITNVNKKKLKDLQKEMQIIFQDPFSSLNPRMSVKQTIAEPLIISKEGNRNNISKKVKEMMEMVGLAKRLENSYPHELDGGRRQRIGIARALVLNPKFIVCDEPVSALDVSIQAQIINLLLDLQKDLKLTYIFITHDLSVVKYVSHNICVMYLGKALEIGSARQIFNTPLHPYTKALISAIPVADINKKRDRIILKGELSSPINPEPCCRFVTRCNYSERICYEKEPLPKEIDSGHFIACHFVKNNYK